MSNALSADIERAYQFAILGVEDDLKTEWRHLLLVAHDCERAMSNLDVLLYLWPQYELLQRRSNLYLSVEDFVEKYTICMYCLGCDCLDLGSACIADEWADYCCICRDDVEDIQEPDIECPQIHKRMSSYARYRIPLLSRDGPFCGICNGAIAETTTWTGIHVDHILPLGIGGSNHISNLQLAHAGCNLRKKKKSVTLPT